MSARRRVKPLSAAQLDELFALVADSDSVELKLTVGEEQRQTVMTALGIDPLEARLRQVWFFDTPDLQLEAAGLVVRARRSQGREPDSVVKLRPVVPDALPDRLRDSKRFVVEVDAMPGGFVCSASFKGAPGKDRLRAVAAGDVPIRKLFSKRQRDFFTAHAPPGIGLDALTPLGPINVAKLKFTPKAAPAKLAVEQWFYPDGSRTIELSTRCRPADTQQAADETRAYLGERGVDLLSRQETKTRKALRHFAKPA